MLCPSRQETENVSKNGEIDEFDILFQKFINNFGSVKFPNSIIKSNNWDQVSVQIWRTYESRRQKLRTFEAKIHIWLNLQRFVLKLFKGFKIYIVGSTMNGFSLEDGDIDVCLIDENILATEDRAEQLRILADFEDHVKSLSRYKFVTLIKAKVPILRFYDEIFGINVDLSCNNTNGVENTYLLRVFSMIDWRVTPLVTMIKLWAKAKNINDAKNMTLSSYSITLMVIHFLQHAVDPVILPSLENKILRNLISNMDIRKLDFFAPINVSQTKNKDSLGKLLLSFFAYYKYFNFQQNVISVRLGRTIPIIDVINRQESDPTYQSTFINIEEPFKLTNTAYAVFNYAKYVEILDAFTQSFAILKSSRNISMLLWNNVTLHSEIFKVEAMSENSNKFTTTALAAVGIGAAVSIGMYLWSNYIDSSISEKDIVMGKKINSDMEPCSICFEDLKEDIAFLPCTHKYHKKCIRQWNQRKCPICRHTF